MFSSRRFAWMSRRLTRSTSSAKDVSPEQVKQSVRVSSDLAQHVAWLAETSTQGWDELYLHLVGQQQSGFIDAFGEHVLPQLSPAAPQPGR